MVETEMELDVSCADFDIDAVKETLAAQYGVNKALITIEDPCARRLRVRALAGLTVSISIAASGTAEDGTAISAPSIDHIRSAVAAATPTGMASALGAALGVEVSVASIATPTTDTVEMTFPCPPGKFCTGDGEGHDCDKGTFNPLEDQKNSGSCKPCPRRGDGGQRGRKRRALFCEEKHFKVQRSPYLFATIEDQRNSSNEVPITISWECVPCLDGVECAEGTSTETLNLTAGRWRTNATSLVIEYCAPATSCVGGTNTSAQCADGHEGPLCSLCQPDIGSSQMARVWSAVSSRRATLCPQSFSPPRLGASVTVRGGSPRKAAPKGKGELSPHHDGTGSPPRPE